MDVLLTPWGLTALGMAVVGVVLFGLADVLPALLPPALLRLVGLTAVCAAALPIYALSGSKRLAGGFLLAGLACIVLLHLLLTRRANRHDKD